MAQVGFIFFAKVTSRLEPMMVASIVAYYTSPHAYMRPLPQRLSIGWPFGGPRVQLSTTYPPMNKKGERVRAPS